MNSKIISVDNIDYTKQLSLNKISAHPQQVEMHKKNISNLYADKIKSGEIKDEELSKMLQNVIVRDNVVGTILQYISDSFHIEYDQEELTKIATNIKTNFSNLTEEQAIDAAKKTILKKLMYDWLFEDLNIQVTDEEIWDALEKYYAATNKSIREYKDDVNKFNQFKENYKEQKLIQILLEKIKVKLELDLSGQKNQ